VKVVLQENNLNGDQTVYIFLTYVTLVLFIYMLKLQSLFGLFVFIFLAWIISENRKRINFRVIFACLFLQLGAAVILLTVPWCKDFFLTLNKVAGALQASTTKGTTFVFGYLGGGAVPFDISDHSNLFILAFQALPLILVVSAISSVLFYWRVLPAIVKGLAFILKKATGISGALGLCVSANIFVGMVEAPLIVKPYISKMTRSELFTLMTSGMATVAGTVMFLYAGFLSHIVDDAIGHILTASIISAPAAILVSTLMVPREKELQSADEEFAPSQNAGSTVDALVKGVDAGVTLLINITAMLIVMVALVALLNMFLGFISPFSGTPLTFQKILGWFMAPVVWLTGIPWSESAAAGQLMGTKTVLNELIAYIDLAHLPANVLSERSRIIMTYSLCGFANFASLGIMIAGLRSIAPDREKDILSLAPKSIIAGTLATLKTGAVAGMIL
jgi:CNT family concentrative nucleoside transporter